MYGQLAIVMQTHTSLPVCYWNSKSQCACIPLLLYTYIIIIQDNGSTAGIHKVYMGAHNYDYKLHTSTAQCCGQSIT